MTSGSGDWESLDTLTTTTTTTRLPPPESLSVRRMLCSPEIQHSHRMHLSHERSGWGGRTTITTASGHFSGSLPSQPIRDPYTPDCNPTKLEMRNTKTMKNSKERKRRKYILIGTGTQGAGCSIFGICVSIVHEISYESETAAVVWIELNVLLILAGGIVCWRNRELGRCLLLAGSGR